MAKDESNLATNLVENMCFHINVKFQEKISLFKKGRNTTTKMSVVECQICSTFEYLFATILHLSSTYSRGFSHASTIHSDHMMRQVILAYQCFST
jgi:hypothetical protein